MRPLLLAAVAVLTSACAGDRYLCLPSATCKRAEAAYESLGYLRCLGDQMKALEEAEQARPAPHGKVRAEAPSHF